MMKIANVITLATATVLVQSSCSGSKKSATADRSPNVIYILADDLGLGDLGCYGQERIKTPNIDALARNGMLFTDHYSGSTVSAPSRCALMTGKHTGHTWVRGNKGVPFGDTHFDMALPDEEITVAEIFRQGGYATACVGKWGLGGPQSVGHPNNQGFDYFYGYLGQGRAHRYYPDYLWENENRVELNKEYYSHDLIAGKALEFIGKNSEKPFFLYFSPTIPHADLDIPAGDLGEYDGMFEEKPFVNRSKDGKGYISQPKPRATFAAMVSKLDSDVGRIVKLLEEKGILDKTIVIFTSDNGTHSEGGHDPAYFNSSGGLRGQKRDLYQGGIRTPFVVQYPGVIEKGTRCDHTSAFWDFLPTVCEIVGVNPPAGIDGISYLPSLTGKGEQKKHDYLYFEFHERGGRRAVIRDGWKLVELNVYEPDNAVQELYDLRSDPAERHNVILDNAPRAGEMREIMLKARSHNPVWNFTPTAAK